MKEADCCSKVGKLMELFEVEAYSLVVKTRMEFVQIESVEKGKLLELRVAAKASELVELVDKLGMEVVYGTQLSAIVTIACLP
jgi:hypothetical protein